MSKSLISEVMWFLTLSILVCGFLIMIDICYIDIKVNDYSGYRIDMIIAILISIIPLKLLWCCVDTYRMYSLKGLYDKRQM